MVVIKSTITVRNWIAKRSGAGITVTGITTISGVDRPIKLTDVSEIKLDGATVVAIKSGIKYQLEV